MYIFIYPRDTKIVKTTYQEFYLTDISRISPSAHYLLEVSHKKNYTFGCSGLVNEYNSTVPNILLPTDLNSTYFTPYVTSIVPTKIFL